MASYRTKLIETKEIAERTKAFYFEKPRDFTFKAGQFLELTLPNPPETDEKGNSRFFSIASAPFEKYLVIASRMRETAFKRVLGSAQMGYEIEMKGPFGSFVLDEGGAKPVIMLAGGIGITPFRSIILQTHHENIARPLFLFYSNRGPEDAPFLDELTELGKHFPGYQCIATMTEPEKSEIEWHGETGYISEEMIKRYIGDVAKPVYYTAGPSEMVAAMRELLEKMGINGSSIHSEDFLGY